MSFVALVVLKIWKCHNRELKSAQSAAPPIILLVAVFCGDGAGRRCVRERQGKELETSVVNGNPGLALKN